MCVTLEIKLSHSITDYIVDIKGMFFDKLAISIIYNNNDQWTSVKCPSKNKIIKTFKIKCLWLIGHWLITY